MRTLCLLLLLAATAPAADAPKHAPKGKPNRLARESSPYLLQHAHNPVNWHPWGEEAFALARKEGKLVFLSIGYSACHWCHVMEKESFADAGVAKILNDNFVCIKVDREERPDVDQIYMTALNVTGSTGGWPLSMFLDDKGRPIVGGTYWPREDKEIDGKTQRGFKSLLGAISKLKKEEPKELEMQAARVARATSDALEGIARGAALTPINRELVTAATEALAEEFDKVHGGFGNAARGFKGPKFPIPSNLLLLQGEAKRTKSKELAAMVSFTLDRMARGGIYDHLGGGFHRYTVERSWTVPHFEKMLYDNAQLLEVFAAEYAADPKPIYRRVMRETISWLRREMTSPEGGFYSALDADSEGEEGRFYVWKSKELDAVLTDKAANAEFRKLYDADEGFNFEGKYHILRLPASMESLAKAAGKTEDDFDARVGAWRKMLFDARAKRERPFLDTKILTAWNGQMIAGLALAGHAVGDKDAVAAAEKAAEFVLRELRTKDGRLMRSFAAVPGEKPKARLNGYLDDYTYLVHGLLALHDVTKKAKYLDDAKALTDTMTKHYGDGDRGGFYYTSADHEKLFVRAKDRYDGAQPSANSMAAANLVRLAKLTKEKKYADAAEKTFKAFAGTMKMSPTSLCRMAEALGAWLEK